MHSKQLGERGTEVALYDYADGVQSLLNHEVRIFVPADSPILLAGAKRRFEAKFEVILYESTSEIVCDALYVIKRGRRSAVQSRVPELNHAFNEVDDPHGHRFAAVSDWLAQRAVRIVALPGGRELRLPRVRRIPTVPHIVQLPLASGDHRSELSIPEDAVVFGRHGAANVFDLEFVQRAVVSALDERSDVWFVFLNMNRFVTHERVIHLPRVYEREDVSRFINTCDYMIHANAIGETFGLAVAEFAAAGVPVITYLDSPHHAHLDLLGPGLLIGYRNFNEVLSRFLTLERRESPVPSDVASRFSRESVMQRFASVFLS
jgi:glycosyltransferase involved in cell wall biosynthesis